MRSMGIYGFFSLFLTEIRINALFWDSDAPVAFSALPVNRTDAFKKNATGENPLQLDIVLLQDATTFDENRTIR